MAIAWSKSKMYSIARQNTPAIQAIELSASSILPYQEYYDRANLSEGSVEHRFVFFDMAIQHVTRAARVFRQPGKHMQMVGVGGTGKATVAKLAAFIEGCVFVRPYVSRTYSLVEFRDDLKKACVRAGVKSDNIVLFLTDNLVKVGIIKRSLRHKLNFPYCQCKGSIEGKGCWDLC